MPDAAAKEALVRPETDPWFQILFEANPLPMFIYDLESYFFLDANQSAMEQYGYSRSEVLNMSVTDLHPPPDVPQVLNELAQTRDATSRRSGVWRHLRKDRTPIYVDILHYRIPFKGKSAAIAYVLDMTELRETQRELTKAQEVARVGSWVMDLPTNELRWSDQTFRNLGLQPQSEVPTLERFKSLLHPDDLQMMMDQIDRAYETREPLECDHRVIWPDGSIHVMRERGMVIFDDNGQLRKFLGTIHDITEQRAAEEKITRLAYYDEVTGLPNRVFLREVLDEAFAPSSLPHPMAVMIIDLLRFKEINHTFGHANGDQLLRECGSRIRQVIKPSNTVARVGNTEFAIVLADASAYAVPSTVQQILNALEEPFHVEGTELELEVKFGVAFAPGHGTDTDTVCRKANVAVSQAKASGQAYAIYQPSSDPYKPQRIVLMAEFRKAIQDGQLQMYCQPKADMRSRRIIGAEALVRWEHPRFGTISPQNFVPLIEQTELIHLLTRFMLQAALRQYYDWCRQGIHIPLAVNLSMRNLMEPDLASSLDHLLLTWGAEPRSLGLEITESSLMTDPNTAIAALDRLSKMGFRLFIDDFGTGYSSLGYLMKLPINVIKIDSSFTMNMVTDKGAAAIVKSTIELAHNLGLHVVAEGTSSGEIWDALLTLGCDEAQGHFISPPMPAAEFLGWLTQSGYDYTQPHVH